MATPPATPDAGPIDDEAFLRRHADRLRDAMALAGFPPGWSFNAKTWRAARDRSPQPGWITFHHAHAPATVLDHAARLCALDLGLTGRTIQQICSGSTTITA